MVCRSTALTHLLEESSIAKAPKALPSVTTVDPKQIAHASIRESLASSCVNQRYSVGRLHLPPPFDLHDPGSLLRADWAANREGHVHRVPEVLENRRIEERFRHRVLHHVYTTARVLRQA